MAKYAEAADNVELGTVTFKFGNEEEGDQGEVTLSLASYPPAIQRRLAIHGLKAKGVDSYSGAKKAVEDGDATSEATFARESVEQINEQLLAGDWSAKREGVGGPRTSFLAEAISRVRGTAVEAVIAKLATMDDKIKRGIAKVPKIALEMAKLRQEAEAKRMARLEEQLATQEDEGEALTGF